MLNKKPYGWPCITVEEQGYCNQSKDFFKTFSADELN